MANLQIDPRLLGLAQATKAQAKSTTSAGSNRLQRQRKSLATYQKFRETLGAKAFTFGTGNFIEDTIILDIGGRYSKVGFVGEPGPRRICKTHLRLGDERKSEPYSTQIFKAMVTLKPVILSMSKRPQSPHTWQEIAELLVNDLLFTQLEIKPDKRRIIVLVDPWWPSSFQNALARSFFRHGCPGLHLVDSLHTALFATGNSSGIVVDVGYHTTKISATVHGHIVPETRGWKPVGFYKIMTEFKVLMKELARLDFDRFAVDEQQIEKAIARTCFVQPLKYAAKSKIDKNANANASANDDKKDDTNDSDEKKKDSKDKDNDDGLTPNSVSYEFNVKKQSAFCKITPSIRRRICEVLFDDERHNIVHFLCDQLLMAPIDCRGVLVNNVLLTGGTVQIPGFEARFIQEWKRAITLPKYAELKCLAHRFRLLQSKFCSNIRMFVGASIYGELTSRFVDELFITKKEFEGKYNSRIDDWTEHSVYSQKSNVKNLTHAEIIRKPQFRGRPNYNLATSLNQRRSIGVTRTSHTLSAKKNNNLTPKYAHHLGTPVEGNDESDAFSMPDIGVGSSSASSLLSPKRETGGFGGSSPVRRTMFSSKNSGSMDLLRKREKKKDDDSGS